MNHPRAFCIAMDSRWPTRQAHFASVGLTAERFHAFDGAASGLVATIPYDVDKPGTRYVINAKGVGMAISHIALWTALFHAPAQEDSWMIVEDDALFDADWSPRLCAAIAALPTDWDMVFLGSCNCNDKAQTLISANLYDVRYPSCTHAYMVRRKALPILLATNKRVYAPIDCSLVLNSFPILRVYTILPRIAAQDGTFIRP